MGKTEKPEVTRLFEQAIRDLSAVLGEAWEASHQGSSTTQAARQHALRYADVFGQASTALGEAIKRSKVSATPDFDTYKLMKDVELAAIREQAANIATAHDGTRNRVLEVFAHDQLGAIVTLIQRNSSAAAVEGQSRIKAIMEGGSRGGPQGAAASR